MRLWGIADGGTRCVGVRGTVDMWVWKEWRLTDGAVHDEGRRRRLGEPRQTARAAPACCLVRQGASGVRRVSGGGRLRCRSKVGRGLGPRGRLIEGERGSDVCGCCVTVRSRSCGRGRREAWSTATRGARARGGTVARARRAARSRGERLAWSSVRVAAAEHVARAS